MIKITVVSYNDQTSILPRSAVFGRDGGTVGRGDNNYFVLPDPKHHVSRLQASIKSDGTRHAISNLSQANPILVNGREIEFGRECDLQAGDKIQIGLYLLTAESQQAGNEDEIVRTPAIGPMAIGADAAGNAGALHVNGALHVDGGAPVEAPAKSAAQVQQHVAAVPAAQPSADVTDAPAHQAAAPAPLPAAENQALLQAFLNGAGIPAVSIASGLTPELMEMVGKLLATAIQGTVDLNALRALVKREAHAEVTMVVVRNNNPLKFFPDCETILTQMLRKKMPGFMGPLEAMQDAYEDLRAHQLGIVAGTRAALAEVLARLDPDNIDRDSKDGSILNAVLPARRKAGLWDRYTKIFRNVQLETRDDFQTLFGKTFLATYEAEIERVKNGALSA
jgi:FHA domain-containing protein